MSFTTSSGFTFTDGDLRLLELMHRHQLIEYCDQPKEGNSGVPLQTIVHGRDDVTDNPEFALLLGAKVADTVLQNVPRGEKRLMLIGMPIAGGNLAAAAAFAQECRRLHHPLSANVPCIGYRVMRQKKKRHGAHNTWVDGSPDPSNHIYVGVDNAVTSGKALFECYDHLHEDGYPADEMHYIELVDRQQGGVKLFRERCNVQVHTIFKILDIFEGYVHLRCWTYEMQVEAAKWITNHQF